MSVLRHAPWQRPRGRFPALGRIIAGQVGGVDAADVDTSLERAYTKNLY